MPAAIFSQKPGGAGADDRDREAFAVPVDRVLVILDLSAAVGVHRALAGLALQGVALVGLEAGDAGAAARAVLGKP